MEKIIPKPERPEADDCCGGGCCPCVWDTYHNQLSQWLEQQGKEAIQLDRTEEKQLR